MPPRCSRAATSCTWWPTTRGTRSSAQIPEAQSALVALDPNDGSIVALVGGFDYFTNKYNRVDPGAAPAGLGLQAVPVFGGARERLHAGDRAAGCPDRARGQRHRGLLAPGELHGEFGGPTRLREALVRSRNLVSIRVLKAIGIPTAIDYISRFGFDPSSMPHEPDARARHAAGDAARRRHRLRGVRQRRLPRRALLHRSHRERRRAGGVAGRSRAWCASSAMTAEPGEPAQQSAAPVRVSEPARACRPASTEHLRRCPPRRWRRGSSAHRTPIS